MKKKSILLLVLLLGLCGCTSKMTCSVEKDGYKSKAELTIKGNEVSDITVTNTYSTADLAKSACGILNLTTKDIECNDKTIIIKNYQKTLELSSFAKDNVTAYFEANKYTCK